MVEHAVDSDTRLEILRLVAEMDNPVGAEALAVRLADRGINLTSAAIRYHLRMLDQQGFTSRIGKRGRALTAEGWKELQHSRVDTRMRQGLFVYETLAQMVTLDAATGSGQVAMSVTTFPSDQLTKVLAGAARVARSGICVSDRARLLSSGEKFGRAFVPPGKLGLATVSTATVDGLLLSKGLLFRPMFVGVVEVVDWRPYRFVDAIEFGRGSRSPVDVLVYSGSTSLQGIIETGRGLMMADVREIVGVARERARQVLDEMRQCGLGGVLAVGQMGQPVLGIPVQQHSVGVVMATGLNLTAIAYERGVRTEFGLSQGMVDYAALRPLEELLPDSQSGSLAAARKLSLWEISNGATGS